MSNQSSFRLMKGRLGVYEKLSSDNTNYVDGVMGQEARLQQHGGNAQQERMIRDKRRSLDKATLYSYQGAEVLKLNTENHNPIRALINPNKLKQDYDDKIISIGYEHDFKPGDVFEWVGTNTYWIIYLQDLTELAYFRGDIRKCSYQINWEDEAGKHSVYAAVRGPVETKINFIQKHGISVDTPNHSLNILLPRNDSTVSYFKRYNKFYLQGYDTCWRVEATDAISTPGILEITAVEYYANEIEDDIENGIVSGLIEQVQIPESLIQGESFIKPRKEYHYIFTGIEDEKWHVDNNYPLAITQNTNNPKEVSIKWTQNYSGQFELCYGNYKKIIVVESLF